MMTYRSALIPLASLLTFAFASFANAQPSPYVLPNGKKINISGLVIEAGAKTFLLDYGKGAITVELDDYDTYEEGFNIEVGDAVIVKGRIDADGGQERTIEAESVFIPELDLRITASSTDEEDTNTKLFTHSLANGEEIQLNGIVKTINNNIVTIQSSKGLVEVHFGKVFKQGPMQLNVGQAIKVTGFYKNRFFLKDIIFAETVERVRSSPPA